MTKAKASEPKSDLRREAVAVPPEGALGVLFAPLWTSTSLLAEIAGSSLGANLTLYTDGDGQLILHKPTIKPLVEALAEVVDQLDDSEDQSAFQAEFWNRVREAGNRLAREEMIGALARELGQLDDRGHAGTDHDLFWNQVNSNRNRLVRQEDEK